MKNSTILDVAIIGGGISGVYSAWRLKKSVTYASSKIALFEQSNRIGGRLLSVTPPGMPNTRCELGGMRFLSNQKYVSGIVNFLDFELKDEDVYEENNIAYLRGIRLRFKELVDKELLPYNLQFPEQGKTSDQILNIALESIIPGVTTKKGEELKTFLQQYKVNGRYLYEYGFWNLLSLSLSNEAINYIKKAGGYDSTFQNWNAYDTIVLNFDLTATDNSYHMMVDGYEQLPITLVDQFLNLGGEVNMFHSLSSINSILIEGEQLFELKFSINGSSKIIYARKTILAMPKRALELIEQKGNIFNKGNTTLNTLMNAVTPIPLFKMFICYPYPWWEQVGVSKGRSVTDLPIRQTYYWGVENQTENGNKENTNAVLMASYDDGDSVYFWKGLESKKNEKPLFFTTQEHAHKEEETSLWEKYKSPDLMVNYMDAQIKEMHGVKYAPAPFAACFKDWSEDPYGGGVNFWNIGEKSWEVIPRIAKPLNNMDLFICGEAYSNGQGWVEGALETAELVLQDHFKLSAPAWIEKKENIES
ncbi:flavin monoamine oxidase family protein [Flammeovirga kamogawensis]|uniref:Tryptophan 2-monooxygenase n=1 Tax=Flammeovirga kamogawensis TaxID=373891 RepID=A0ABX8H5T3_9BACT|nr:FAD-dependent oxidoreductase [Flammeovirga kamogawensis]MBB6461786.1 monoamine oxidase [Flammeovirga kamogawensis]QWG10702.1 FAD-dependent oxidoreductase [Flammeovirga kamogawensis]